MVAFFEIGQFKRYSRGSALSELDQEKPSGKDGN